MNPPTGGGGGGTGGGGASTGSVWPPKEFPLDDAALADKNLNLMVDIFHINIGEGDCTIYYLVQHPPPIWNPPDERRAYVHRACLIDGGKYKGKHEGATAIRKFLEERVPTMYFWDERQGGREPLAFPPFDSIVITHWDIDHYKGVIDLITDHMVDYVDKEQGESKGEPDHKIKLCNIYLSPYMKYKTTTEQNQFRRDRALTYLYVPYFNRLKTSILKFPDGVGEDGSVGKPGLGVYNGRFFPNYDGADTPRLVKAKKGIGSHFETQFPPSSLERFLDWSPYADLGWISESAPWAGSKLSDRLWATKLCHIRSGNNFMLGANLFTNFVPPEASCAVCPNPAILAAAHKSAAINGLWPKTLKLTIDENQNAVPFLLLIGANGEFCGQQAPRRRATTGPEGKASPDVVEIQARYELDNINPGAVIEDREPLGEMEPDLQRYYKPPLPTPPSSPPAGGGGNDGSSGSGSGGHIDNSSSSGSGTNIVSTSSTSTNLHSSSGDHIVSDKESGKAVLRRPAVTAVVGPTITPPPKNREPREIVRMIDRPVKVKVEAQNANAVSINTMVVWSNGQISQYAAGDAYWECELEVLAWVQKGQNPFQCVRSIKIQHHGSRYSTPTELIRGFRPRNVVISCNTDAHTHPSPEVILWLALWFRTTSRWRVVIQEKNNPRGTALVQSTTYPNYLTWIVNAEDPTKGSFLRKKGGIKLDSFSDASAPYLKWRGSMIKLAAQLADSGMDYVGKVNGNATLGLAPIPDAIYQMVYEAWPFVSSILSSERKPDGHTTDSATKQIYNSGEEVQYVKVHCRPWTKERRSAADNIIDGYAIWQKWKYPGPVKKVPAEPNPVTEEQKIQAICVSFEEKKSGRSRRRSEASISAANAEANRLLDSARAKKQRLEKKHGVTLGAASTAGAKPSKKRGPSKSESGAPSSSTDTDSDGRQSKKGGGKKGGDGSGGGAGGGAGGGSGSGSEGVKLVVHAERRLAVSTPVDGASLAASNGPADIVPGDLASTWSVWGSTNTVFGLADGDLYNNFLAYLGYPAFTVTTGSTFTLSLDDTFANWMLLSIGAIGSEKAGMSLKLTGQPTATKITQMSLDDVGPDGFDISFDTSTTSLGPNFAKPIDPKSSVLPSAGVFEDSLMLTLGLSPVSGKRQPWTFTNIVSFLGYKISKSAMALDKLIESGGLFNLEKGMIWVSPVSGLYTTQRMEWSLDQSALQKVQSAFSWIKNTTITRVGVVARRTSQYAAAVDDLQCIERGRLLLLLDVDITSIGTTIEASLDFEIGTDNPFVTFTINLSPIQPSAADGSKTTFSGILGWIGKLLPLENVDQVLDWLPVDSSSLDVVFARRVELTISCPPGSTPSITQVKVDIEIAPGWKNKGPNDGGGDEIILLMTYTWRSWATQKHSLAAQVWFDPGLDPASPLALIPQYEPSLVIWPSKPAASGISIISFLSEGDLPLPSELDLEITCLMLSVQDNMVSFSGKLEATGSALNHLGIELAEVDLNASYSWATTTSTDGTTTTVTSADGKKKPDSSTYSVDLALEIDIASPPSTMTDGDFGTVITASISLVSENNSKFFRLAGGIQNLCLAQLTQFFPGDDAEIVTDLLGHLTIRNLNVLYDYTSTPSSSAAPSAGVASQFTIAAVIIIDAFELDLFFTRNQTSWDFTATLQAAPGVKATVGSVLSAILGSSAQSLVSSMPSFITGIDLADGNAALSLEVSSYTPPKPTQPGQQQENGHIAVSLDLTLPGPAGLDFDLTFVQVTEKIPQQAGSGTVSTGTSTSKTVSRTKRLIRGTVGDLPWSRIPNPPIVDRIVPAFDELGFYWVHDPVDQQGLTVAEITAMNSVLVTPIQYKQLPTNAKDTTIALAAGMHFVVLDSGGHGNPGVVLDYQFNKPKAPTGQNTDSNNGNTDPSNGNTGSQTPKTPAVTDGVPDNGIDGTGTAKGSLEKDTGSFKISNVGIRFEGNELIIFLDIFAHLGPIEFELMGLGFGMDLNNLKLNEIGRHVPTFHLQGMALEFNQPPVAITGMFIDKSTDEMQMYIGGVGLTIEPYSFIAVGAYGEVKKPSGGSYKTVFLFAKLNGPLIELEVITIGGICLGFGYNSTVTPPAIQDVTSFPFISQAADLANGADPLAIMTKLSDPINGIVRPQDTSYWFAAGLEGKLLEVLDVSACVILEFNPYVSIGIYARASETMPPDAKGPARFSYVELGIMAYVDFRQGQFKVEAQLSPNSFILSPLCHLAGGFALCNWFGDSPYAGDFVFSVGGYHPAYKPPAHYPVPQRLSITWALSDNLMIRGEAYFAITTKVCMGGGRLDAVFNMGLLSAYLSAHADFLMNFHPFHFTADIGIAVGVEFDLELLFITIHISVQLNAGLHLEGPPFGGYVFVDFWVFGFTIPFGDDGQNHDPLTLEAFCDLLTHIPDASSPSDPQGSTIDQLHVLSVESGRFTENQKDNDTKQGAIWEVKRGGFVFRVQSRIPLETILEPTFVKEDTAHTDSNAPFYAKPMHLLDQLGSVMQVTVTKSEQPPEPEDFQISAPVMKNVPLTLWGVYDPNNDPGGGNNNISDLLNPAGGTTSLMMGASFVAPPPFHSFDKVQKFNALDASAEDVFDEREAAPQISGTVIPTSADWNPDQPVTSGTDGAATPWVQSLKHWMNPDISPSSLPAQDTSTDADQTTDTPQEVVDRVIEQWTEAFGWDSGVIVNNLKVQNGEEPIVWRDFQKLYMAAPMVGVVAVS